MRIAPFLGQEGLGRKTAWFAIYTAVCATLFVNPLRDLFRVSLSSDTYSHILVVPWITIGLIWMERKVVFEKTGSTSRLAAVLLSTGSVLWAANSKVGVFSTADGSLALAILAFLCMVWSGFAWVYGSRAFRAGLFPLLFLLLMLPPPVSVLDRFIVWLQWGTAELTSWLFRATGTPAIRDGLIFTLPGVTIEIAKECSGIRSATAVLVTCLAAGYLFLKMAWTRAALLSAAVPVLILKNGIRITTLTLLAIHVDPGFLDGRLHHQGGVVFFAVGLVMLLPILLWLQSVEGSCSRRSRPGQRRVASSGEGMPRQIGN